MKKSKNSESSPFDHINSSSNNDHINSSSNNDSLTNQNNPTNDRCGNGVIDPDESCDPAIGTGDGSCPNACAPQGACTQGMFVGSAASCDARCEYSIVTSCVSDDGCCPSSCDDLSDSDCSATCDNGSLDPGETCDGDCPTSCNDNNACTSDNLTGSATNCSAQCINVSITQCMGGDGCCPAGCTYGNDHDCTCQKLTCDAPGRQCGSPSDGCGGNLSCGGCQPGYTCSNFTCVPNTTGLPVGSPCTSSGSCAGAIAPFCVTNPNFKDGYCSSDCQYDNDCASGSHCGQKDSNGHGSCLKNCSSDADCRTGYACYDQDNDGSGSTECLPSATGTGTIGSPCSATYDCSGGTLGFCASPAEGLSGGYCTQSCADFLGISTCPSGSTCYGDSLNAILGSEGYCAKTCTSSAQCRTGYSCQSYMSPLSQTTYQGCLPT